jgi:16S rRNA C1402 N4-methylase RsmH
LPIVTDNSEYINITKHPILPSDEELLLNLRSRSAKLRGVEKK